MQNGEDFFSIYMNYVKGLKDVPPLYHYWCAVSGISTTIGKQAWVDKIYYNVYPNNYIMLLGPPGNGKGTAITILRDILIESGYEHFAANRSSKEKFLQDFHDGFKLPKSRSDFNQNEASRVLGMTPAIEELMGMKGQGEGSEYREVLIVAEEFNDFTGPNPGDFISLLTGLWSHTGPYQYRLKTSKDSFIPEPCINILSGNTPTGFASTFSADIMGDGFLARLICIHGEPTGTRTSFPTPPDPKNKPKIVQKLKDIRNEFKGLYPYSAESMQILDEINQTWEPLSDGRFQHYSSRRFTHLLKLCLVFCAGRMGKEISVEDVRQSNTLLTFTETVMPRAIGEFGRAKNSDVVTKVAEYINSSTKPLTMDDIFKHVATDVSDWSEVAKMLTHLIAQKKVMQKTPYYLPLRGIKQMNKKFINEELMKSLQGLRT